MASESTTILVDCGFSYKEAVIRLRRLGIDADNLSGIVVTHEHADHISGVDALATKHNIPVYASRGTWIEFGKTSFKDAKQIMGPFSIDDINVSPITVPHDAREPLQFVFAADQKRLGILSDLGSISARVLKGFQELDAISLEFNHDLEILKSGPYPSFLKERVGGNFGHLNNDQASGLLRNIVNMRLRAVVACHISETNNEMQRVEKGLNWALNGHQAERWIATQSIGFDWITL